MIVEVDEDLIPRLLQVPGRIAGHRLRNDGDDLRASVQAEIDRVVDSATEPAAVEARQRLSTAADDPDLVRIVREGERRIGRVVRGAAGGTQDDLLSLRGDRSPRVDQADESQRHVHLVAVAEIAVPTAADQADRIGVDRRFVEVGAAVEVQVELARGDVQNVAFLQQSGAIGSDGQDFRGEQLPTFQTFVLEPATVRPRLGAITIGLAAIRTAFEHEIQA